MGSGSYIYIAVHTYTYICINKYMCISKNKVKEAVNLRIGRIWKGLKRGKGSGGKWYNSILIKMFKRDYWAEFTMLCFKNCFRVCVGFLEVGGGFVSEVLMWSYPKIQLRSGWCLKASVFTDWKSLAWLWSVLHSSQSVCTSWTTGSPSWGFGPLVN